MKKIFNIALLCASLSVYAMHEEAEGNESENESEGIFEHINFNLTPSQIKSFSQIELNKNININLNKLLKESFVHTIIGGASGFLVGEAINKQLNPNYNNKVSILGKLGMGFGALTGLATGALKFAFKEGEKKAKKELAAQIKIKDDEIKFWKDIVEFKFEEISFKNNLRNEIKDQIKKEVSVLSLYLYKIIVSDNSLLDQNLQDEEIFNEFYNKITTTNTYSFITIDEKVKRILYFLQDPNSFYSSKAELNNLDEIIILKILFNYLLLNENIRQNELNEDQIKFIFTKDKFQTIFNVFLSEISYNN
jgi:hypothetical protein